MLQNYGAPLMMSSLKFLTLRFAHVSLQQCTNYHLRLSFWHWLLLGVLLLSPWSDKPWLPAPVLGPALGPLSSALYRFNRVFDYSVCSAFHLLLRWSRLPSSLHANWELLSQPRVFYCNSLIGCRSVLLFLFCWELLIMNGFQILQMLSLNV